MNPTGGNSSPDYPYFITNEALVVKKILVPKGTKLFYEEQFFKKGEQNQLMSESKLETIELPAGKTIDWAGVPVTSITKFYNSKMRGFTVYADFNQLLDNKKTKFSELWKNCNNDLGITVKNIDDWSFNTKNIADIESCNVLNQRYFKEDTAQQNFLDNMYAELMKIGLK